MYTPATEIFGDLLDSPPCLVPRVDLCMHNMTIGKRDGHEIMHMGWEASK